MCAQLRKVEALAYAMNSGTVLAGTAGLTTMTRGSRLMLATGAMSWIRPFSRQSLVRNSPRPYIGPAPPWASWLSFVLQLDGQ
jgi:hypothetical protein